MPQGIPSDWVLMQNFPNPFNPSTTITFGLPQRAQVRVTVYNTLGEAMSELVNGDMEAGYHEVQFDGKNLSSGVYFYRMQAGSYVETKKLILTK
jgi:flagellar hook assembly protein FlgD